MNDTDCERCGEVPADTLVEHVLYAEAVCYPCQRDESERYEEQDNGKEG